jgi:predicted ferric reductase
MSWKIAGGVTLALLVLVVISGATEDSVTGTATWDASRAAGFAGYLLLWLSLISGMALPLRLRTNLVSALAMLELHRIVSALALSFVLAHAIALLLDPVVHFGLPDAFLPFTSDYRPIQVGLGTLGEWLLIAVLASTALASRMTYRTWRRLHFLSFPCWALALVHGITAGSDSGSTAALLIYAFTASIVAALLTVRLFGRGWIAEGERSQAA